MSKTRKITDSNLEHIILSELKEADRDVFIGIVERLYPVRVDWKIDSEVFEVSPTIKGMTLKDVFGEKMLSLFE